MSSIGRSTRVWDASVAIKVIAAGAAGDRDRRDRFLKEARAASALNHPNIVTIHEVDHANGIDFLVMELVGGRPLNELIPRGGMPVDRVLELAEQMAGALAAAHAAGIVHRDVKPANIVIADGGQAKMLDFGLAKPLARRGDGRRGDDDAAAPATELGIVVGTVAYMSPEQAQGRPIGDRSDIFSFGAVLYEMLAGRKPFAGDSSIVTVAGILTQTPAPIGSSRSDVPGCARSARHRVPGEDAGAPAERSRGRRPAESDQGAIDRGAPRRARAAPAAGGRGRGRCRCCRGHRARDGGGGRRTRACAGRGRWPSRKSAG